MYFAISNHRSSSIKRSILGFCNIEKAERTEVKVSLLSELKDFEI